MREVAFPVEKISGLPVVITPEEIDITKADGLQVALLRAAAQGRKTCVVDMTRTRFCDSAGLHALLGAHRRARAEGGEVRFVVTGPAVRRVRPAADLAQHRGPRRRRGPSTFQRIRILALPLS